MKKILCTILCFLLLVASCSCTLFNSSDEEETLKLETTSKRAQLITKEEVEKAVNEGKISGMQFALGTKIDTIKSSFLKTANPQTTAQKTKIKKKNGTTKVIKVKPKKTTTPTLVTAIGTDESYYEYYVGSALTSVSYKTEKYFYVNGKVDKGAAIAVCLAKAYNFDAGNCLVDDVINSLGEPDNQDVPTSDQLFFCMGSPANVSRLTYNFGTKRLDFIFENDMLLVTVLTDTTLYNSFKNITTTATVVSGSSTSTVATTTK